MGFTKLDITWYTASVEQVVKQKLLLLNESQHNRHNPRRSEKNVRTLRIECSL